MESACCVKGHRKRRQEIISENPRKDINIQVASSSSSSSGRCPRGQVLETKTLTSFLSQYLSTQDTILQYLNDALVSKEMREKGPSR